MNTPSNENKNETEPLADLEVSEAQSESAKGGDSTSGGRVSISSFNFMKKVDKTT